MVEFLPSQTQGGIDKDFRCANLAAAGDIFFYLVPQAGKDPALFAKGAGPAFGFDLSRP